MPHLSEKRSRFEKTPPEWLEAGGQLAELANRWSDRSDIISFVGDGAGHGAAACFVPNIAEMEVDVSQCFGGADPRWVPDLTERDNQFDYPAAMGAVLHEAMHAKHSTWPLEECAKEVRDRFEHDLITNFEETRIERRGVARYPENRAFMRACALKLSVSDLSEDRDFASRGHQSFSQLALLTLARVDAGVLEPEDVRPVRDAALKLWGEELLEKLRLVWVRAQQHDRDDEWRPLHALALEWIKLLEDAGHEPREEGKAPEWLKELLGAMMGAGGQGEDGEEGEGEGGGAPGILAEMAEVAEARGHAEGNEQAAAEDAKERADAAAAEAKEQQGNEQTAAEVFGRGTGPGPANTNSRLIEKRQPTGPERAAAVQLAKALERAQYRDRVVVETRSQLPPGRLRMRSAMAGSAAKSRGMLDQAEPWQAKRRRHTDDPELKVGMMVDISGSMRRAMEPMAVAAWVMSEAVRRVQGTAAMVYFGNDVFPTLAPGQHLGEVRVYSAADGTERFNKGFKALQGRLDLLGSPGARLLVVVSDLYHQGQENEAERRWFARCRQAGVAVVVVTPDERMRGHAQGVAGPRAQVLVLHPEDPSHTARAIGEAAIKELRAVSQ